MVSKIAQAFAGVVHAAAWFVRGADEDLPAKLHTSFVASIPLKTRAVCDHPPATIHSTILTERRPGGRGGGGMILDFHFVPIPFPVHCVQKSCFSSAT